MSVLDPSAFIKPVEGHENVFAFQVDFIPEGKAVDNQVVTELEDGDLIIEGYAAVFDGLDRQNENFTDGAFQRGIKSFLDGQAALCYHHKHDKCLGKVLDLREEEGKGLKLKARVDGAIRNHPELGTIYQQIKRGTLNALSVGGFFKRALTDKGWRIADCDFTEISVTPVPVHPRTNFAVLAGKALEDLKIPSKPSVDGEIREEDEAQISFLVSELDRIFTRIEKRGEGKSDSPSVGIVD